MPSKPICRKDCTSKMQLRTAFVSRKYEDIAEHAGVGTPTYNYFAPISGREQRNAYVFKRESLLRILFGEAKINDILTTAGNDILEKAPDTILAIMGAHHKDEGDFVKGQPTVILIGTKESQNEQTGELKYEIIPPHFLSPKLANVHAVGDQEVVGEEFPPSLVINNPPISVTNAMTAQKEKMISHSFKII